MNSKYELVLNDFKLIDGIKVFRIRALKGLRNGAVKSGDLGGYIESDRNLSFLDDSNCWIFKNAIVYGKAEIWHSAVVTDNAIVSGSAIVSGKAWIRNDSRVSGRATISDYSSIEDNAIVDGSARISGQSVVSENAKVSGSSKLEGAIHLRGLDFVDYNPVSIQGFQTNITVIMTRVGIGRKDYDISEVNNIKYGNDKYSYALRRAIRSAYELMILK